MKKQITAFLALALAAGGALTVNAETTLEELRETFSLTAETEGMSADELMEKG